MLQFITAYMYEPSKNSHPSHDHTSLRTETFLEKGTSEYILTFKASELCLHT